MSTATTDISDDNPQAQVCAPIFRDFGGLVNFHGPIRTLKLHEDNTLVRDALAEDGAGAVLVVDAGGSDRCAVVGGNLGVLAEKNNWAGIVVFGYVRDADELMESKTGIKALGTHPKKTEKRNTGQRDIPVRFADVSFAPGAYLYADRDGVVVSETAVHG